MSQNVTVWFGQLTTTGMGEEEFDFFWNYELPHVLVEVETKWKSPQNIVNNCSYLTEIQNLGITS